MFLYFIQSGDAVKIGVTADPDVRLAELQVGNPVELRLLAATPASAEDERKLHQRFASGCIRGEWFRLATPGLVEEIARIAVTESLRWIEERTCLTCGQVVDPPRRVTCSQSCANARKREATRRWKEARR